MGMDPWLAEYFGTCQGKEEDLTANTEFAGGVREGETVSAWADLAGDPSIKPGDKVLLCRHRKVDNHGFNWGGVAIHKKELYVNEIVTVVEDLGDDRESKIGYISFRNPQWPRDAKELWWRKRDVIKIWARPDANCPKCQTTCKVEPTTPYQAVVLCPKCGGKRNGFPPSPELSSVFFMDSTKDIQAIEDEEFAKHCDAAVKHIEAERRASEWRRMYPVLSSLEEGELNNFARDHVFTSSERFRGPQLLPKETVIDELRDYHMRFDDISQYLKSWLESSSSGYGCFESYDDTNQTCKEDCRISAPCRAVKVERLFKLVADGKVSNTTVFKELGIDTEGTEELLTKMMRETAFPRRLFNPAPLPKPGVDVRQPIQFIDPFYSLMDRRMSKEEAEQSLTMFKRLTSGTFPAGVSMGCGRPDSSCPVCDALEKEGAKVTSHIQDCITMEMNRGPKPAYQEGLEYKVLKEKRANANGDVFGKPLIMEHLKDAFEHLSKEELSSPKFLLPPEAVKGQDWDERAKELKWVAEKTNEPVITATQGKKRKACLREYGFPAEGRDCRVCDESTYCMRYTPGVDAAEARERRNHLKAISFGTAYSTPVKRNPTVSPMGSLVRMWIDSIQKQMKQSEHYKYELNHMARAAAGPHRSEADYAQIELRIAAEIQRQMERAGMSAEDAFKATADAIYGGRAFEHKTTRFTSHGMQTGRFSSKEPNLQELPESEERKFRKVGEVMAQSIIGELGRPGLGAGLRELYQRRMKLKRRFERYTTSILKEYMQDELGFGIFMDDWDKATCINELIRISDEQSPHDSMMDKWFRARGQKKAKEMGYRGTGVPIHEVDLDQLAATKSRGFPVFEGVPEVELTPPVVEKAIDRHSCMTSGDQNGYEDDAIAMAAELRRSCEAHEKSRAGIKEQMEELQAKLDELGPEEAQVGGEIDLRGWLDRPVGVPSNLPKKYKVEL